LYLSVRVLLCLSRSRGRSYSLQVYLCDHVALCVSGYLAGRKLVSSQSRCPHMLNQSNPAQTTLISKCQSAAAAAAGQRFNGGLKRGLKGVQRGLRLNNSRNGNDKPSPRPTDPKPKPSIFPGFAGHCHCTTPSFEFDCKPQLRLSKTPKTPPLAVVYTGENDVKTP